MADKRPVQKCECGGEFYFNRHCGAMCCLLCDNHKGLCRCYCGWSADGGNGYAELEAMGEQIEADY